jgi:hypothetical protein
VLDFKRIEALSNRFKSHMPPNLLLAAQSLFFLLFGLLWAGNALFAQRSFQSFQLRRGHSGSLFTSMLRKKRIVCVGCFAVVQDFLRFCNESWFLRELGQPSQPSLSTNNSSHHIQLFSTIRLTFLLTAIEIWSLTERSFCKDTYPFMIIHALH